MVMLQHFEFVRHFAVICHFMCLDLKRVFKLAQRRYNTEVSRGGGGVQSHVPDVSSEETGFSRFILVFAGEVFKPPR